MGIAHNSIGNCQENLPRTEKDLMFFFNTVVACIIDRTFRKQNTNEVKDSVIFLQPIFRGYTTLHQGYETVIRNDVYKNS